MQKKNKDSCRDFASNCKSHQYPRIPVQPVQGIKKNLIERSETTGKQLSPVVLAFLIKNKLSFISKKIHNTCIN